MSLGGRTVDFARANGDIARVHGVEIAHTQNMLACKAWARGIRNRGTVGRSGERGMGEIGREGSTCIATDATCAGGVDDR